MWLHLAPVRRRGQGLFNAGAQGPGRPSGGLFRPQTAPAENQEQQKQQKQDQKKRIQRGGGFFLRDGVVKNRRSRRRLRRRRPVRLLSSRVAPGRPQARFRRCFFPLCHPYRFPVLVVPVVFPVRQVPLFAPLQTLMPAVSVGFSRMGRCRKRTCENHQKDNQSGYARSPSHQCRDVNRTR